MTARTTRIGLAGAAVLVALVLPACSDDDDGEATPSSTTTTTASSTPTSPTTTGAAPTTMPAPGVGSPTPTVAPTVGCGPVPEAPDGTYAVGEAGTVQIRADGTTVELVEASAAAGWTASGDTEDDPDEVEVTFRRDGREIEFEAEIDDGRLEVEVCDR